MVPAIAKSVHDHALPRIAVCAAYDPIAPAAPMTAPAARLAVVAPTVDHAAARIAPLAQAVAPPVSTDTTTPAVTASTHFHQAAAPVLSVALMGSWLA